MPAALASAENNACACVLCTTKHKPHSELCSIKQWCEGLSNVSEPVLLNAAAEWSVRSTACCLHVGCLTYTV